MNELKLTKEDYKKIDSYLKTKNDNLIYDFYIKFGKQICNIVYSKINFKLYSTPFERDDIVHIVWKCVEKSFKEYDSTQKSNFMKYLINKCYQTTLREIRKFFNVGERIMNNVISYESCLEDNKYFDAKTDNIVYIKKSYSDSFKDISNFIINNISKVNKNDVKKVIYLKSLGCTVGEIEKKLNFSHTYVRRIINLIKKIGEKY